MMVIAHSNTLESSTRPAENPSTGCFDSSARVMRQAPRVRSQDRTWGGRCPDDDRSEERGAGRRGTLTAGGRGLCQARGTH